MKKELTITVEYSDKEAQVVAAIVKTMDSSVEQLVQTLVFTAVTSAKINPEYIKKAKENLKRGFEKEKGWIVHDIKITISV